MARISSALLSLSAALALGLPAHAAETPVASPLADVARSFEAARVLGGADRLAALESVDRSLAQVVTGKLDAETKAEARFLSGAIAAERGQPKAAYEAFRQAADLLGKGP